MPSVQENISLDSTDAKILSALAVDSRRSYADVGGEVGLSTAAVHERVKKLVERGVIERFSLELNAEKLGLHFTAFVAIRNERAQVCDDIAQRLAELPQILELHSLAGEYDFIAKVRTEHAKALEEVLYRIKGIEGIARTTTTVVLTTAFESRPMRPASRQATGG